MRISSALTALFALGVGALAAPAATAEHEPHLTSISPVFHQLVAFSLPPEFKSANATYEKTSGFFYIREHVPQGESVDHWTQMITLTATRDLASNPGATPGGFAATLAAGFRRHCPDTYATVELGPETVDAFAGFAVIASCGHVTGGAEANSETAIILAVKGTADYYTLQWARHGPDSHRPLTLDVDYWKKQFDRLRPIKLCPIVPGEGPPYGSCLGKGDVSAREPAGA
ncbi:MAG TPA: hypothetical protein VK803_06020 [Steroidobacteraceae bacterium]|jgi:hypothetical protein|nr:hypothetical protein [Steroidobacteraceae bacterium]